MVRNALTWFEIPVSDFNRARVFYNRVFDYVMPVQSIQGKRTGFLLFEQGKGVGGAIVEAPGYQPCSEGVRVYLSGGQDLNTVLNRVESAGGRVLQEKTLLSAELGHISLFLDTEGNCLGLHSLS